MTESEMDKNVEENRREYGEGYAALRWLSAEQARRSAEERASLVATLGALGAQTGHRGSKLYCRALSPGCRRCGEGLWSCLFVNGLCNSRCFYCPTPQKEKGVPSTNAVSFPNPLDYADYLRRFELKGASISGGEPLLTLSETLSFLRNIRKICGPGLYLWLYTNGILLTGEIVELLREAGLDEIRFDIGARGYRLDKVRLAVGRIPRVTVEIPAIPEDFETLTGKLEAMKVMGVDSLNLHQLRLTPHNYRHLSGRGYTFLHGPKVTVLESELTALKVLAFSLEKGIHLPVHYCSFPYKNRYQAAGSRRRYAGWVVKGHEEVTETGMIRRVSLKGSPEVLSAQAARFEKEAGGRGKWCRESGDRLAFHGSLWHLVDFSRVRLAVNYYEAFLMSAVSYRNPFTEVTLNPRKSVVVERARATPELELGPEEALLFGRLFLSEAGGLASSARPDEPSPMWSRFLSLEVLPSGLSEYY